MTVTVNVEGEQFDLAACSRFAEAACAEADRRRVIFRTLDNRFLRVTATDLGRVDRAALIDHDCAERIRCGWSTLWSQP